MVDSVYGKGRGVAASALLLALIHKRPRETVWKIEWDRSMTYAPEHETDLLNRSFRRRMGVFGAPCSGFQQARTTENPQQPRGPQRHFLRLEEIGRASCRERV